MKCIAIDFGGTTIKLALFRDGRIMRRKSIPAYSEKGLGPRLPDTKKAVLDLLEGEELSGFSGVGIAMPGIVDPEKKRVLGLYKKYEDSKEMDLEGWCREAFGIPF